MIAAKLTLNADDVINDPEIDVVIEVMGGVEETRGYLLQALKNKKHVVTANKDLMALYGPELLKLLQKMAVIYFMKQVLQVVFQFFVDLADGLCI